MRLETRRQIKYSGIWALAAVFFLSFPHAAIDAVYVVLWLCIRLPFAIYRAYKQPDQRTLPWVIASVWTAALFLVVGIHFLRHEHTRANADRVVASIKQFYQIHGRYPGSLTEAGFKEENLYGKLGLHGYRVDEGEPHFFYAVTYVPFETWDYDFPHHHWVNEGF